MTQPEYEQKKRECFVKFCKGNVIDQEVNISIFDAFDQIFDRAHALGKQETKQETNSSKNENTSNYSGNHFAGVSNMFDTRLHIAAMVMAGALANKNVTIGCGAFEDNQEYISKTALMYVDALIAECESSAEPLCPAKKGGNQ